jgi:hypothetical protein
MNVFELRDRLIQDYGSYIDSFINIRDPRIAAHVRRNFEEGVLWPDPLIQLNPSFQAGDWIDDLVKEGVLHAECSRIFRIKPAPHDQGKTASPPQAPVRRDPDRACTDIEATSAA